MYGMNWYLNLIGFIIFILFSALIFYIPAQQINNIEFRDYCYSYLSHETFDPTITYEDFVREIRRIVHSTLIPSYVIQHDRDVSFDSIDDLVNKLADDLIDSNIVVLRGNGAHHSC